MEKPKVGFKSVLKRPLLVIVVLWLVLTHGGSTYLQVPRVSPELYHRRATDLRVSAGWRYGYVRGQHGAHLVRARNVPESCPDVSEIGDDGELSAAMQEMLKTYPLRAILETVFYAFLVWYAFFAVPWLRNRFVPGPVRRVRKLLFDGAAWVLGWTIACLPLLCLGYGASLFSTWAGPGAAGFSGPYLGMVTGLPGETISYRPILEAAAVFPLAVMEGIGLAGGLPEMPVGPYIWISGIVFFVLGAALVNGADHLLDAIIRRRDRRRNG